MTENPKEMIVSIFNTINIIDGKKQNTFIDVKLEKTCCNMMKEGIKSDEVVLESIHNILFEDNRWYVHIKDSSYEGELEMPIFYCPWCGTKIMIERSDTEYQFGYKIIETYTNQEIKFIPPPPNAKEIIAKLHAPPVEEESLEQWKWSEPLKFYYLVWQNPPVNTKFYYGTCKDCQCKFQTDDPHANWCGRKCRKENVEHES